MLPERLYVRLNAADAVVRFTAMNETIRYQNIDREQLQRMLAEQAGKLFVLNAHTSLDSAKILSISIDNSPDPDQLRIYDRDSERDPQTNRRLDMGQFVVSNMPPPELTIHGDIHFWLDQIIAVDR